MQINRKCGLACVTNYLSARYTLMGFGPTQRGPTLAYFIQVYVIAYSIFSDF